MKKSIETLALCFVLVMPLASITVSTTKTIDMQKTQAPGYFRYMLGNYEITSIYDGFTIGDSSVYYGQDPKITEKVWKDNFSNTFLQDGKLQIMVDSNTFLVNTGKELILIDAGSGDTLGPTMGQTVKNIILSGYKPENINKILITHAHPDHVNGLTVDGKMIYPNATVYLNKADYDFWIKVTPDLKKILEPYMKKNQCIFFKDGDKITDGVKIISLPGHSVGHTGYEVTSNNEKLLFWGDIIHDADVQFLNMNVETVMGKYDEERVTQEINMAKDIVNKVVNEKKLIAGAHLSFPGIGHVIKNKSDTDYRFIPIHYNELK